MQNIPILSVRLKMPEPRKNYIIRHNLFKQLDLLNEYQVTVVKAGAGSGKTTLLSSYVKEKKLNCVKWITLDENANQSFIFWKYVLEALKEYLGEDGSDLQDFFDANIQKENLWQILSLFVNKVSSLQDIILVFDDFQVITDEFLISTIDYLIANMGENFHIVLLTREMPNLYLGSLAMEDRILVIDENEIRLSVEESKNFLQSTLKVDKNELQLQEMIESSNGWIGGLQLLAAAVKETKNSLMQNIRFSNRMMEDYITKEIFRFLTKEEQDFLTKTAILRYFNKEICNRYLPEHHFEAIIESIMQKNLFVISIDDENRVFRYHAILYDYLTGLFQTLGEEKRSLHALAAEIYYDLGDYEESLHHLFKIEDYETIMEQLLKMPQTALTFSYMMKVPMEEIKKNTDFAYQYFFCYYACVEMEACEKIYEFIKNNMQDDDAFAAFMHSDLFFSVEWKLDKVKVIPYEQIEGLRLNPVTIAYLLIKESFFLYASGRNKEALNYLERAEKVYQETGNLYIGFFVLAEKAQILEDMGELKECLSLYEAMVPMIEKVPTLSSSYYIGITGVYTKQMALKKAGEALEKAKECIPKNAFNINHAYSYTLSEYLYMIGDYETSENILKEIMGLEIYQDFLNIGRLLRYPIYRGNHSDLAAQFAEKYEMAKDKVKVLDTELLYAGIKQEAGEKEEALAIINKLISNARKTQNKLKIVEGDLLKAHFLQGEVKNEREILNLFIEAVTYAYGNHIALPFWFEKNTVETIMTGMENDIRKKLSTEEFNFIKNILYVDTKIGMEVTKREKEDLSEREREVLNELAKGHSNKQIAENLCISLATVKSHVINIYGKLGVNNRVAAINKFQNAK